MQIRHVCWTCYYRGSRECIIDVFVCTVLLVGVSVPPLWNTSINLFFSFVFFFFFFFCTRALPAVFVHVNRAGLSCSSVRRQKTWKLRTASRDEMGRVCLCCRRTRVQQEIHWTTLGRSDIGVMKWWDCSVIVKKTKNPTKQNDNDSWNRYGLLIIGHLQRNLQPWKSNSRCIAGANQDMTGRNSFMTPEQLDLRGFQIPLGGYQDCVKPASEVMGNLLKWKTVTCLYFSMMQPISVHTQAVT